jgi:hypothetical protein
MLALRTAAIILIALVHVPAFAQGTLADYQRAMALRDRYEPLATGVTDQVRWVYDTHKVVYRKTVRGGTEFVVADAETKAQAPAFDHAKLAAGLSAALKRKVLPLDLPFTQFTYSKDLTTVEFQLIDRSAARGAPPATSLAPPWRCSLEDYTCVQETASGGRGRGGRGGGGLAGPVRTDFDINGAEPKLSPDGRREALIRNYNVAVRTVGSRDVVVLSTDGSEGGYYDPDSLTWSPDSTRLAAYKIRPGQRRYVHYVESSPEDQLQPKHSVLQYAKPGDVLDVERPVLFQVDAKTQTVVDPALFPNAYDMSRFEWRRDSSAVTFEYNERGHQVYRVIAIDAASGRARAAVTEESRTFFCYSGKKFRHDLDDGEEIIWMSERDGWNHLYLYDGATGKVKAQITKGAWPVRSVVQVDEKSRQIYFTASGMYPGKDPYFVHYYRINVDGTGLLPLTKADANHAVVLSADARFLYRYVFARGSSAGHRTAPDLRWRARLDAREGRHHRARESRLESARGVRREGARRDDRHLGRHRAPDQLRPRTQIPRDREHLCGSAGLVRPQVIRRRQRDAGPGGHRVHRRADRRHGHEPSIESVS